MSKRLPVPRIERHATYSVLVDAEEGCYPCHVDRVHLLSAEGRREHNAPDGSWRSEYQEPCYFDCKQVEAEDRMIERRWGGLAPDVPVIERRRP
jgi:hypothetical protein